MTARVVALALVVAVLGCATPGPTPPPVTPPSAPFVCSGAASVPDFDGVTNDLMNAAQLVDDAEAEAAIDKVAAVRGAGQVACTIGIILPDLRAAPQTGLHLEVWQAMHDAVSWERRHSPPSPPVWRCHMQHPDGLRLLVCQDNTGGIGPGSQPCDCTADEHPVVFATYPAIRGCDRNDGKGTRDLPKECQASAAVGP